MNRIIFTGGQVFDGTGAPPVPADVVVRGDRVETVRPGGGTVAEPGDQVVDCAGATVMPGLVESHCHLTFPSALATSTRRSTRRWTSVSSATCRRPTSTSRSRSG